MSQEIAAGQVWVPRRPGSRTKPRTVVWFGAKHPSLRWVDYPTVGWVIDPANPAYPETGHDSWITAEGFRRWARKHDAAPAPVAE